MNEYHRIYAEININAILHNINLIRNTIPQKCMIMPVIKADAYGHGAIPIAKAIKDISDFFGVATIEEAIELRNAGIKTPILILGTLSARHFKEAVLNNITVNIYTASMAQEMNVIAKSLNRCANVHIAVDTGMSRIGLPCDLSGIEIIKQIISHPNLNAEGLFTHFATADEADKSSALKQRDAFRKFCSMLSDANINIPLKHICNSAAICDMNDECYSMVRPGIILYGLNPSDEILNNLDFIPAMSLKSHVSYIKKISKGTSVSYGYKYTAPSDRIIATIPVGYADGYPRLLSGKGKVIINGKYAPIVGRVCMDQFMVDITDIDGVNTEDKVTLIGSDRNISVSTDEIADICGTINYEIVCGIGKRVPRVYIREHC